MDKLNCTPCFSVIMKTFFCLGSRENTVVNLAVKHAFEKPYNKRVAVPASDFKLLASMYTKRLWQTEWESYPENKSYTIQLMVDSPIPSHRYCCEQTVLQTLYWSHF